MPLKSMSDTGNYRQDCSSCLSLITGGGALCKLFVEVIGKTLDLSQKLCIISIYNIFVVVFDMNSFSVGKPL